MSTTETTNPRRSPFRGEQFDIAAAVPTESEVRPDDDMSGPKGPMDHGFAKFIRPHLQI